MLKGRVAVITGGASGMGAAGARRFVEEGARVVIADVQEDEAKVLAAELGGPEKALAVRCDVSNEADIEAAVATAVRAFGGLDIMWNNAGVMGALGPIEQADVAAFDRTLAIDLRGVVLGIKHASRAMMSSRQTGVARSGDGGGPSGSHSGGCIINTSSVCGLGVHGSAAYMAAKAAVIAVTKLAAAELAPAGIRVNSIAPGGVATPMIGAYSLGDPHADVAELSAELKQSWPLPGSRILPADIANAALFLASDLGKCVNAHVLVVDLGLSAGVTGQVPAMSAREPVFLGEAGNLGLQAGAAARHAAQQRGVPAAAASIRRGERRQRRAGRALVIGRPLVAKCGHAGRRLSMGA